MSDLIDDAFIRVLEAAEKKMIDDFLYDLDEMLEDERYRWAFPTLEGIRKTVKGTRQVTEGQKTAVGNIKRSVGEDESAARRPWPRRYEGMK